MRRSVIINALVMWARLAWGLPWEDRQLDTSSYLVDETFHKHARVRFFHDIEFQQLDV